MLTPLNSVLVVSLVAAWLSMLAVWAWRRRREFRAKAAAVREEFDAPRPVTPGLGVVAGLVEYVPGERVAAHVECQQGRLLVPGEDGLEVEQYRESWLKWMRPFYIRAADGQRVLVRPTPETLLIDDVQVFHTGEPLGNTGSRVEAERHIAWLAPDERVVALGEVSRLQGTSGGPCWVLDSPAGGPMKLATRPVDERHFNTQARHGELTLALSIGVFLFLGVFVFYPFYGALLSGEQPQLPAFVANWAVVIMSITCVVGVISRIRPTPWWETKGARGAVLQAPTGDTTGADG